MLRVLSDPELACPPWPEEPSRGGGGSNGHPLLLKEDAVYFPKTAGAKGLKQRALWDGSSSR